MNFGTNFFSEPLWTVIRLAAAVTVFENNQKCLIFKVIFSVYFTIAKQSWNSSKIAVMKH